VKTDKRSKIKREQLGVLVDLMKSKKSWRDLCAGQSLKKPVEVELGYYVTARMVPRKVGR